MPAALLAALASIQLPLFPDAPLARPTPLPDAVDLELDTRLAAAWGDFDGASLAEDAVQPPPIRPTRWWIAESGAEIELPELGEWTGDARAARTTLTVASPEIRFARAPGVTTILVNGEPFQGDPERRGDLGVPIVLRAGENSIEALGLNGGFELELWQPMTQIVIGTWAVRFYRPCGVWPELSAHVDVPLFNASISSCNEVEFSYGRAVDPARVDPKLTAGASPGMAVPLGLAHSHAHLFDWHQQLPSSTSVCLQALQARALADDRPARALLAVPLQGDPPQYGGRQMPNWPRSLVRYVGEDQILWGTLFVVEDDTSDEFRRAALAAARWAQQSLWYRASLRIDLVSESHASLHFDEEVLNQYSSIVTFGRASDASVEGLHRIDDLSHADQHAVRASDASAFLAIHRLDPFFSSHEAVR